MSQAGNAESYPRQELLVEPEWLVQHLDDQAVRVIDCDTPEIALQRPHIPGAVRLPIHPYFRDTDTGVGVATPEQTEAIMASLGVSNDMTVVCYDSTGGTLAARIWWVLWYYGHEHARFLNGGLRAWNEAGLPTETEWQTPPPGNFGAATHEERIASCDTLLPHLNTGDMVPLDVRAIHEWAGTTPNVANEREGHIPGAVHIEWREFVNWDQATRLKPAAAIDALLKAKGVTRDKLIVPY